jgi:anti-sigma regulatory factor (Ser/Thr protein kinase)
MVTTLPLVERFRADPSSLADVRAFVHACARDMSIPERGADDLALAITEACRDLLAHERSSILLVSWWAHDGLVEMWVRDEGADGRPSGSADDDAEAGLGFPYILAFIDELEILPGTPDHPGTTIRLVKGISAS